MARNEFLELHFLSLVGPDGPGIIADISRILLQLGCNLEDVTMTILDGQFAMMVIFRSSKVFKVVEYQKAIRRLEFKRGLTAFSRSLPPGKPRVGIVKRGDTAYIVHAIGPDRMGIVYEMSNLMARLGINITDLNSKCLQGKRKPLYALMIEMSAPNKQKKAIEQGLKAVSKRLGIDIKLNPVQNYQM